MGRPTVRTEENAEAICNRLINGESLVEITDDPAMPGYTTILGWLQDDLDFRGRYARARELQAYRKEHEAMHEVKQATIENVQVARLRYDALKWQMGKLNPKVYGDKTGDINNSVVVNNISIMSEEKRKEIQARCREALAPPDAESVSTLTR